MSRIVTGDDWLLIQELAPDRIRAIAGAARGSAKWEEVVPGIDSLALKYDPLAMGADSARQSAEALIETAESDAGETPAPIEIAVCYDPAFGPDQAMVAEALGIAVADLAEWHRAQRWTVAMLGFLPGFAYLASGMNGPDIPRLDDPRARVEAGSVGVLGQQCGIYPVSGPGGWPIIGRTTAVLFAPDREPPALLQPGQPVRFVAIDRATFESSA